MQESNMQKYYKDLKHDDMKKNYKSSKHNLYPLVPSPVHHTNIKEPREPDPSSKTKSQEILEISPFLCKTSRCDKNLRM